MAAERESGLFETLYTTRALRRLRPDPIPDELLFRLFDAAIRAPSGGNAQDWRFVIISERAIKEQIAVWFREAWVRYRARFPDDPDTLPRSQRLSLRSTEYLVHHLAETPVLVAACGLRGRHTTPGGSIFPAVQNLLLAARALGLGGSITNFAAAHEQELRELLSIPDSNQIYCLIPLGYPLDQHGPVRRRPVQRSVFLNRWQQPWPFAQAQPEEGWPPTSRDT